MTRTAAATGVRKLPVYERFMAWQGEGVHMGRSAFFIRLFGCPVQCPWCDSAGTWHPDYIPRDLQRYMPGALAREAAASGAAFTVITGGEPTIHDLTNLTTELHALGQSCHLETSGGFPIQGHFDWITLSPKWAQLPLPENIERANELKLIIDNEHAVADWLDWLGPTIPTPHVWLHPEWSQRTNPAVLAHINQVVKERGDPFRAGYQIHKAYAVDEQDERSRQPVPLPHQSASIQGQKDGLAELAPPVGKLKNGKPRGGGRSSATPKSSTRFSSAAPTKENKS